LEATSPYLLVVEDSKAVRAALELLFAIHDIPAVFVASADEALARLKEQSECVVLSDMNFSADRTSGEEGARLFRAIRANHPNVLVILMTAWASLEMAVALVKEGAEDYITKPWDDDALLDRLRSALGRVRGSSSEAGLVYVSEAMTRAVELAKRVAGSDAPVLLTGPNGSGKERIAEIIHAGSLRAARVFLRVDVGALPESLLEAELFGADAGAYTGATRRREGLFEAAEGGTLFLDEIGNLPLSGQAKLLRVLESGDYRRLGSAKAQRADVRVIAATNVNLPRAIAEGTFREDLYFRLAVIQVRVPPLSERRDDILPLAEHFLRVFGQGSYTLDAGAIEALQLHGWPGNVRELENRVRSALVVTRSRILDATALGLGPVESTRLSLEGDDSERRLIEAALDECEGVVVRAAVRLGISRQTLYRKMQRLGIQLERRVRE
jgi:DNA-binding NtrC family response regulator